MRGNDTAEDITCNKRAQEVLAVESVDGILSSGIK
jgi:hypothetical protein